MEHHVVNDCRHENMEAIRVLKIRVVVYDKISAWMFGYESSTVW